jgi:crotonobetainyl-CoA:carnitine CoA-transferase CaiB-like acyl-CoA transferase
VESDLKDGESHGPGGTAAESPLAAENPLAGLKVLDAATLLAGPLSASLLGDLGADVIKVESPQGDPIRGYPPHKNGVGLLHKVTNRNKKSITLNFREVEGRALFKEIVSQMDVAVLNFRPATMQKWGLTYPALSTNNGELVMLQVSAFGATGPYSHRPGFARVAEAFCGLAHITGFPDRDPVLSGYPVVDAVTGLFGSFAIMTALHAREHTGRGSFIDLALYEPMLRLMEDLLVSVGQGTERSRVGNQNPFVAPNDMFECNDGRVVVLPISTDQIFARFASLSGREDLNERFPTNAERVANRTEIDSAVTEFMRSMSADEAVETLTREGVPVGRVYSPSEILRDEHVRERGNLVQIFDEESGEELTMQAPLPLGFGQVDHPGRPLGEDNFEVYSAMCGLDREDLAKLKSKGVI